MKIRHPALIRALGHVTGVAVRGVLGTLHFREHELGAPVSPSRPHHAGRYIYTPWHEDLLLASYQYGRPDIHVLVSQHADGELITQVICRLGFSVVRGSSTHGGVQALRQCLRVARGAHLAVTPDGPRGPRRRAQDGIIYLASRTGLQIVPMGMGYCRPWRARSWDRLVIPRPGSQARCVLGHPIAVPREIDRGQIEARRQDVENALNHVSELAQHWAETGAWPEYLEQRAAA